MTGKRIPDTLTLVDSITDHKSLRTLVVSDEMGYLLVEVTQDGKRSRVTLNDIQAQKLASRISKFFRENR